MRMPNTIEVLKPTQIKNEKGVVISKYVTDYVIQGNFQPLKYNVQYKPYGITDKTSNILYCQDFTITANKRIGFNGNQYIIDAIMPWPKHVEIYLEKVI